MVNITIVVVDKDPKRANEMVRMVSGAGYAFPVAELSELGSHWPEDALLFVADEGSQLRAAIEEVRERAVFYAFVPYGKNPDVSRVVEAIKCGAVSYLRWPCSQERVSEVVSGVASEAEALYREKTSRAKAFALLKKLTSREAHILDEIAKGKSSKEISYELNLSRRTVEAHRAAILSKLEAPNVVGAVRTALDAKQPELPAPRS